jgi:hypothetical protein
MKTHVPHMMENKIHGIPQSHEATHL